MDELKFDVASHLALVGETTSRDVATRFGVTLNRARRALDALVMQGTATCAGNTRARKYTVATSTPTA